MRSTKVAVVRITKSPEMSLDCLRSVICHRKLFNTCFRLNDVFRNHAADPIAVVRAH